MNAAMKVMSSFDGRKILVLADMLELGDYSASAHAGLSKPITELDAYAAICIGSEMKHLVSALGNRQNVFSCADNSAALEILLKIAKSGDNILFKGSNSMNLAGLVNNFKGEWKNGN